MRTCRTCRKPPPEERQSNSVLGKAIKQDLVQNRSRMCTSPPAAFGGRSCPGESDESRQCNARPCPGKENTLASYTLDVLRQNEGNEADKNAENRP